VPITPETKSDFGGNYEILRTARNVYAAYEHLQPGSLTVKDGDKVNAGTTLAKLGNTGPSQGPHLHFGLLDKPDLFAGRSRPFVLGRFTLVGAVDFEASEGDHLVISPESRQVRRAYPLYGGIQNFP
jgi:murein DD-endopeptidase MepM/ murein hydrolase activator NlpD